MGNWQLISPVAYLQRNPMQSRPCWETSSGEDWQRKPPATGDVGDAVVTLTSTKIVTFFQPGFGFFST